MPARMSIAEARIVMFTLYPIAFATSLCVGGSRMYVALMLIAFCYNHCGGSNGLVSKNLWNVAGFVSFASGAMEVMLGMTLPLSTTPRLVAWLGVIGLMVFTTVHLQDLPDRVGGKLAGRRTMPLVLGDARTRWFSMAWMVCWSACCRYFWGGGLGVVVGFRCLMLRELRNDAVTWRLLNLWMVILYAMPLIAHNGRVLHWG
ncbi:hypothetical protein EJ02DRAFT_455942 [Clathrospora elynae]|uniref:Uncharacterized protein n=1 Tax=Clathrospora elynae TaxID=706981 RepID=A0A6A5SPJ9_9PLEO|nr:hypothetical protein EJ02DRAFT_455942 [Clathrospora elynae]